MLSADCFVAMGAAAVHTNEDPPRHRRAGALQPHRAGDGQCLATLNQLAPGASISASAPGFTARRAMGFAAIKVKDMETYVHQVYGLLRRETVDFEMEGQSKKIRFLNPELPLFNTQDPIALHFLRLRAAHAGADRQVQGRLDRFRRQGRERRQGGAGDAGRLARGRARMSDLYTTGLRAGLRAAGRRARPIPSGPWPRPARARR
jgi:hypothetical protein